MITKDKLNNALHLLALRGYTLSEVLFGPDPVEEGQTKELFNTVRSYYAALANVVIAAD